MFELYTRPKRHQRITRSLPVQTGSKKKSIFISLPFITKCNQILIKTKFWIKNSCDGWGWVVCPPTGGFFSFFAFCFQWPFSQSISHFPMLLSPNNRKIKSNLLIGENIYFSWLKLEHYFTSHSEKIFEA